MEGNSPQNSQNEDTAGKPIQDSPQLKVAESLEQQPLVVTPRKSIGSRWREVSKSKKILILTASSLFLLIILSVSGYLIYNMLHVRDINQPTVELQTKKPLNNYFTLVDQTPGQAESDAQTKESKYEKTIFVGPSKQEVALERIGKVEGDSDAVSEQIANGSSYNYQLVSGGKSFYKFSSKFWPSIYASRGDNRIILQKYQTSNATISVLTLDGDERELITEPDDALFLLPWSETVSRNSDKLVYTKVSAQNEACGGPTNFKIPDYNGPIVELHALYMDSGEDITIVKDTRKPMTNLTEDLPFGLTILGYSADDTKIYAQKAGPPGCSGLENKGTYEISISQNGTVRQIPYNKTVNQKEVTIYPERLSEDGLSLYYVEYAYDSTAMQDVSVYHKIDLKTGSDTIVSKQEAGVTY